MLWVVEARKNLPLFAALYLATIIAGILRLAFPGAVTFSIIQGLGTLRCWSAAVIYAASIIFRYLAFGRDLLLQIGTVSRWRIVWIKATVLGAYMLGLHLVSLALQIKTISETAGSQSTAVLTYMVLAKLLSITAFLTLVVFLSSLVKLLRGRASMLIAFSILLLGLITCQTIALWQIGAPNASEWFIGVQGDFYTVNLYSNILPIILSGPADGLLPPATTASITINAVLLAAYLAFWALFARTARINFLTLSGS